MHHARPTRALAAGALAACALAASAAAQTALVQTGDVLTGIGQVTRIDDVAVNSSGEWIVEVDTDNASSAMDAVILENGAVKFHEGTAVGLTQIPGATLAWGDRMAINDAGETMYLRLLVVDHAPGRYVELRYTVLNDQVAAQPTGDAADRPRWTRADVTSAEAVSYTHLRDHET